ncbi:hypothetical protein [Rhizobium alvei]|uniref:Uncharacterized protein n=1 Tax=Rhizobium alvei TaxID=1132659 RepID=A0ABT8YFF1_9HYPH|nr:hypothetical protein [Rhizobium alvei]MDO6962430.1 hypothetical protein [Rhizobium alvei]
MFRRLSLVALCLLPSSAWATGGVWCDAEDSNIAFHVKAVSSRDGTGPWFGIEGAFALKDKRLDLPPSLLDFPIADANITERWWDGEDVRLNVQKSAGEADNFARVRIIIKTKAVEEADYRGTYELDISPRTEGGETRTFSGKIACSAD